MTSTAPAPRRVDDVRFAATLCLTLLTCVTAVSMCRVFADWAFLRPMLAVIIGTHVMAAVLRAVRAPVWVALPVVLLALFVLLSIVYYRDSMAGPFPTSQTVSLMRLDLRLVFQQFPTAVAPVPSAGNFATSIAGVLGLCAVLSDTFAFRAFGRVEAVVPSAVLFVFAAALGTDRHRVAVAAAWIAAALLTVAVLRFAHIRDDITWMGARRLTMAAALPAMLLTVSLGAVAAAAVAPRLPGAGERALFDPRHSSKSSTTEILNPLVRIRARMTSHGKSELFTVRATSPHYWRVAGLPIFDGDSWSMPQHDTLVPVGDRSSEVLGGGQRVTQTITVLALTDSLVPAAYEPTQVAPDQVMWAGESQSLILPDNTKLRRGDKVEVASQVVTPTIDQLRAATVSNAPGSVYYALPPDLPSTAHDTAVTVTATAPTPYDQAIALQTFFQTQFTYNLDVQFGNSADAIEAFLRGREGFCQQFAGTFAVMARSIGLPARVAVGYTQGDLGTDGLYHVFGRHAHAWPEVWFDGFGWVAFEPTPGRGSPDGVGYTGLTPRQDDSRGVGGRPQSSTVDTAPKPTVAPTTTAKGQGRPTPGTTTTTIHKVVAGGSSEAPSVPYVAWGALVALLLWVVAAPRLFAAVGHRRARSARDRVVQAWYRTCRQLTLAGAPPVGAATPFEYVRTAQAATGVDGHMLRELATEVTKAVYGIEPVDEATAVRCETLATRVDNLCRVRMPWALRVRALVDPRMMLRRATG